MSDGNNIVQGIAAGFCDVVSRLAAELKERRRMIIDQNYRGDEVAYTSWATETFSPSGGHAEYAELQWLKAQTTPANPSVPSDYPG